ncbi:MAG: hypothetical protein ACK4HV_06410, partial [Parachlamydiaceae bacterium]
MEGPSLRLAAEQLAPLSGKIILKVGGNSRAGIKRLENKQILSLFFSRKTACFQFDSFALNVHFMLYGIYQAYIDDARVAGDYPVKNKPIR